MDSLHLLTKEFDERRPLMQKLKKYYDTPAVDKPMQRHQLCAARKSINHIPSDIDESESESSSSSSSSLSLSSSENIMQLSSEPQENIMPTSPSPLPANSQQMDLEDIMNDDEGEGEAAAASSGSDSDKTEQAANSSDEDNGEAVKPEQPVESLHEEDDGEVVKTEQPVQSSDEEDASETVQNEAVNNSEGMQYDQGETVKTDEAVETLHEEDASTDSELEEISYLCSRAKCGQVFDSAKELKRHEKIHKVKQARDGRIHCDEPGCKHHYGTKRALQRHKKNNHDTSGKHYYCTEKIRRGTRTV